MTWRGTLFLALVGSPFLAACGEETPDRPDEPEAISLLGVPLYRPLLSEDVRIPLVANLTAARAHYDARPDDADAIIWLGRRYAYLGEYREAIRLFTVGIAKHPEDPRMYRHRGHRYLTVREFDRAVADLEKAAALVRGMPDEVEPDGAPNARNIPTSTTQGNIYYHLALVHFMKGGFEKSLAAWNEAMGLARNDDTRVAVSDWMYMTLRRLGQQAEAEEVLRPITDQMDIIENTAYHRRLLMYKGVLSPDSVLAADADDDLQYVTQGYGVANWYLANGDSALGNEILDRVLATGYWAPFGFIAAEADVARGRLP